MTVCGTVCPHRPILLPADKQGREVESGVPLDSIKDSTFKLDMHPNPSDFSPSQIQSVAAYVWTLSRARIVKPPAP